MVDMVRLPDDVESGAKGGPNFSTSVITLASGRENRNQEWGIARHTWDVGYGIANKDNFELVRQFFYTRHGRARSFLFKDWSDYHGDEEPMAAVTGQATKRQLVKTYSDGVINYVRKIEYPVSGTLHIYVNTLETFAYSIAAKGVVTFTGDPGGDVVATFDYDIPVRFDTDTLALTVDNILNFEIPSLTIAEVIGDD
jgi:uncharacterized protein (TIGR02217 family)